MGASFKRVMVWATAACALWLGGCTAVFGPRTVDISQAQMQQWVDRQFPLNQRLLDLFDVSVATPRLELRAETNRIATTFDVSVSDRVFKSVNRGTLGLDYAVRFEPADNTVRVSGVRVERFEINGASIVTRGQLERIGSELAQQLLNERVVYTLRPKDVEAVEGRGYRPSELRVTRSGLAITLLPVPPR